MRDVICNAYACFGRKDDEQGINLANQVCRRKDEMISVEIDIRITGNGCTVCKWQARQVWHKAAFNSAMLLRMQQETMLQHPNMKIKHTTGDALQKRNTELWLIHIITGSNKHGESAKNYQAGHGINSITKQCSEQVINMLQELIIAKQDMV